MDKIQPEYIAGYRQAMLDVRDALQVARQAGVRFTSKRTLEFMDFLIANHSALRDGRGRVCWDGKKFELIQEVKHAD